MMNMHWEQSIIAHTEYHDIDLPMVPVVFLT